jgi:hypothetical protein
VSTLLASNERSADANNRRRSLQEKDAVGKTTSKKKREELIR